MDQDYNQNNFDENLNVPGEQTMPQGHSRKRGATAEISDIPEAPSRARQKKKGNVLTRRIIIFAILEVLTICGILGYAYVSKQYSKIQRLKVDKKEIQNVNLSQEEKEYIEKGYWNIAVFGVDSRDSSVGKGANSDVIIIVSINRDTGEIKLVSVYRDTYMKTGGDSYNKINYAYCAGGPERALKALNEDLDLNITQYVTFNWKAVATAINILGGVDIELSKAEFAYINGFITETVKGTGIGSTQLQHAGMNHLDGVQAVAYARLRKMDNDYARTERQRKIIQQCFEKAKQATPEMLNSMIGVMLEMVATNLTWQDGLDAVAEISKYHIGETGGFPFARGEANLGKLGACIIPLTLESNVRDLHQMLFAQEGYDPSEQVKQISAYISAKTGYYNEGKHAAPVSTEGYMPSTPKADAPAEPTKVEIAKPKEEETDGSAEGGEAGEEGTAKSKKDQTEYAISKDGYLIYVTGTDPGGNKTYKYKTDDNGKRIKMIDYDENGNVIYLYEVDEDGNFYFDTDEILNDTNGSKTKEKETDENGNVLPGQEYDENYGPGGGPGAEPESGKTDKPGEKPTEKPTEGYGPGVEKAQETEADFPGEELEPEGNNAGGDSPSPASNAPVVEEADSPN